MVTRLPGFSIDSGDSVRGFEGAAGNAAAATAAKGTALVNSAGEQLARLLQELMLLPLTTVRD